MLYSVNSSFVPFSFVDSLVWSVFREKGFSPASKFFGLARKHVECVLVLYFDFPAEQSPIRTSYHVGASCLMGAPRANYNDSDADQYLGRLGTFTNTMSPKNTSTLAKSPHLASEMIQSYPDFSADFENDLKSYKLQSAMAARAALQRLGAGAMGQEAVDRLRSDFRGGPDAN